MGDAPDWARPLSADPTKPDWARPLSAQGPSQPIKATADAQPVGPGATFLMHAQDWMTGGLGHKLTSAIEAAQQGDRRVLQENGKWTVKQIPFSERYKNNLEQMDAIDTASEAANPKARYAGDAAGLALQTAATLGAGPALRAAGLLPKAAEIAPAAGSKLLQLWNASKQGGKAGTVFGAAGGYGADRSDSALGVAARVLGGSAAGGVAGAVAPWLVGGVDWLANKAGAGISALTRPAATAAPEASDALSQIVPRENLPMLLQNIKPTEDARTLQKYGVNLTVGQMQPGSVASEAEELSGRLPIIGKKIAAQRQNSVKSWQQALREVSRPPKEMRPMVGEPSPAETGDIMDEYEHAYSLLADRPAPIAATHPRTGELVNPTEAFQAIATDPSYMASPAEKDTANAYLQDQLGKLYEQTEGGKSLSLKHLIDMRSGLRRDARDARRNPADAKIARMVQDAADSLTGSIQSVLNPQEAKLLSETDRHYSSYMNLLDAEGSATDRPGGVTPHMVLTTLKNSLGKRRFARDTDAGGELRELGSAARQVFAEGPHTGFGEQLGVPFAIASAPAVYAANASGLGRDFLTAMANRPAPMSAAPSTIQNNYGKLLMQIMRGASPASSIAVNKALSP